MKEARYIAELAKQLGPGTKIAAVRELKRDYMKGDAALVARCDVAMPSTGLLQPMAFIIWSGLVHATFGDDPASRARCSAPATCPDGLFALVENAIAVDPKDMLIRFLEREILQPMTFHCDAGDRADVTEFARTLAAATGTFIQLRYAPFQSSWVKVEDADGRPWTHCWIVEEWFRSMEPVMYLYRPRTSVPGELSRSWLREWHDGRKSTSHERLEALSRLEEMRTGPDRSNRAAMVGRLFDKLQERQP